MLESHTRFDQSVFNSVFITALNRCYTDFSVQYEGRIVGVGTSARGGTPGKPYDTAGGA
jgi:hypothetical protein